MEEQIVVNARNGVGRSTNPDDIHPERVVSLEVADDGPGIPDDETEVVFRRGNRGLILSDTGNATV